MTVGAVGLHDRATQEARLAARPDDHRRLEARSRRTHGSTIEVTGDAPTVDVRSSAAQKNLTDRGAGEHPVHEPVRPGRHACSSPGVNPNKLSAPSAAAATSSNAYMIDGVDVSDPRRRHALAVRQLQLVPGGAGHRPRRDRRVRRVHRRGVQQPVPLRRQQLLGAVRNAVPERRHDRRQHLRRGARAERRPHARQDATTSPTPRSRSAGRSSATSCGSSPASSTTGRRRRRPGYPPTAPDTRSTAIGPEAREEIAAVPVQADDQAGCDRSADRVLRDRHATRSTGAAAASNGSRPRRRCTRTRPRSPGTRNYTKVLSTRRRCSTSKYSGFWGYYYLSPTTATTRWGGTTSTRTSTRSTATTSTTRTAAAPGQRQPDQVRVGLRGRAQPEVRRRVRAQLRQERIRISGRRLHPGVLRRALLRVSLRRLSARTTSTPAGPPSRRTPGRSARSSRSIRDSGSIGTRGYNKHLGDQVLHDDVGVAADRVRVGRDGRQPKTVMRGHYGWYLRRCEVELLRSARSAAGPQYGAYIDHQPELISDVYLLTPGASHTMDPDIKHPRHETGHGRVRARALCKTSSVGVNWHLARQRPVHRRHPDPDAASSTETHVRRSRPRWDAWHRREIRAPR